MKDFASYGDSSKTSSGGAGSAIPSEWEEEARRLMRSFNGKGEGELMRAIFEKAIEGKRNGTLTNEQIDLFYSQFAPMLDGAKKKKLQKIVAQLKSM